MNTRKPGFILTLLGLFLLLTPTAAAAQSMGNAVPGAITVSGEGTASAPAESALVVITLGTDGNVYYDPATGMPNEEITAMEIDATPIVDALVALGIPVNDIDVQQMPFIGEWGSGDMPMPVMIVVTVTQPTVENLSAMLEVVRETATTEGIFVNQFGVMYSVADCRPLRQRARANAVANARMEAEDQAAALNTTVGEVVASRDGIPMGIGAYQPSGCTIGAPVMKPYDAMYSIAPFDPRQPAQVSVSVAVEVSFQIP